MSDGGELWDGRWVVCRAPTLARAADDESSPPHGAGAIVGLDHLPAAAQPSVIALLGDLSRPVDAQVALPLRDGGHALLTVRGEPAHVEVLVRGAGPRRDSHPGDPVVAVLADGRHVELDELAACVIDPDGTTSSVSPALVRLTGSAATALRRDGIGSVIAPEDHAQVVELARRITDRAEGIRVEPRDGGPPRWVTIQGLDVRPDVTSMGDPAPTDHGRMLVFTELHARAGELARAAHRARVAFEGASVARARVDAAGVITAANRALGRLAGVEPSLLVGRALSAVVDPTDRAPLETLLAASLAGDLVGFEHEVRLAPFPLSAEPTGAADRDTPGAPGSPDSEPGAESVARTTTSAPSSQATPELGTESVALTTISTPSSPEGSLGDSLEGGHGGEAIRWGRVQVQPVTALGHDGEADVEIHDVTSRRRAEREARDTVDALRAAFIHAPTPMAVIELDGVIREANAELRALLDLGDVDSGAVNLADLAPDEGRDLVETVLADIALGGRARVECRLRRHDGGDRLVELSVSAVTSIDHPSAFAIVQVNDITAQRSTEEKLLHQTLHDPLTGLGNRLLLRERLERAIVHRSDSPFALMFIDLDHFKWTNDTHGHEAGDALLVEIARRLRTAVRGDDTVARLGGDEFVILASGVSDEAGADVLAGKIRDAIATPFSIFGHTLTVTASIGIVLAGDEHTSADALLRDADLSMYRAKANGRDRHDVTVGASGDEDHTPVTEALRTALDTDSLQLHHQPIVDLRTGRAVGTEALLRVSDPIAGTRPPGRLLDGITDPELLVELAGWVLDSVLEQMVGWDSVGLGPLGVWLNLSGIELQSDSLLERVSTTLTRTGIDPTRIHLEIPEPALLLADNRSLERLRTLAALGVRLGIDDFGTGSTSLAHLRSLPMQFLKIDPSIGRRLREPGGRAVVEAVVAVGRALGLDVVAEGIEDRAQMEALAQLGCTHAQGNLFAAPAPADQLSLRGGVGGDTP